MGRHADTAYAERACRSCRPGLGLASDGAVTVTAWGRVVDFADNVDEYVQKLDRDVHAQIVWIEPSTLGDIAKDYGSGEPASVSVLRARKKARGEAQTGRDLAFADRWNSFLILFDKWIAAVRARDAADAGDADAEAGYQHAQEYASRLRVFDGEFRALGATHASYTLPRSLEPSNGPQTPTVVYVVAGAAALGFLAYLVHNLRR